MRFRVLFLGALAVLAAGCGSTATAPETVTTATVQVTPPQKLTLTVFKVDNGLLRPRVEQVPHTTAVAEAALAALAFTTPVTVSGGTAKVALAHATQDEEAEIVYTLTQYATIQRV